VNKECLRYYTMKWILDDFMGVKLDLQKIGGKPLYVDLGVRCLAAV